MCTREIEKFKASTWRKKNVFVNFACSIYCINYFNLRVSYINIFYIKELLVRRTDPDCKVIGATFF